MWFKNIRAYRLTKPFDLSPEALGEKLAPRSFVPCAKSQAAAFGWVPPLGEESGELVLHVWITPGSCAEPETPSGSPTPLDRW